MFWFATNKRRRAVTHSLHCLQAVPRIVPASVYHARLALISFMVHRLFAIISQSWKVVKGGEEGVDALVLKQTSKPWTTHREYQLAGVVSHYLQICSENEKSILW